MMKGRTLLRRLFLPVVAGIAFTTTSCVGVHYDADPFTGHIMTRASGYTTGTTDDWLYYRLEMDGELKPVYNVYGQPTSANVGRPGFLHEGEQTNRTDWDLAICGYHIRTNSGTSGIGKGGAYDLGYSNYKHWQKVSDLPTIDESQWVKDDSTVNITWSQAEWMVYVGKLHPNNPQDYPWFNPNSGPPQKKSSANPLLDKSMVLSGPPMTYTPSFHTYLVRTADGKRYFKLQIVSWYNEKLEIDDQGGQMSYYADGLKE